MGDGISDAKLREAEAAGTEYRREPPLIEAVPKPIGPRPAGHASTVWKPGARLRLTDAETLLYKSADSFSAVLADLDRSVAITVVDLAAHFIHVRLIDGTDGYILLFAGLAPLDDEGGPDGKQDAVVRQSEGIHYRPSWASAFNHSHPVPDTAFRLPGTQFRLTDHVTPLYEKSDGWSDVARQLSSGTIVTFHELVGSFAHVTTDGTVGYIPGAAGASSISPT